ncbi:hypothetical protein BCR35DRAFT_331454 [Leucosporidium creatinivorum]|uniref:Uncharacterized protein n=1 Tax=Leucosporidium creatinivorum TaxID=106004 RepID=A0A1Y2FEN8_9BASI|nr:hypothetical protein BCR35DRAFT_331454 [Leucosporidium creatinivorum]
MSRTSSNKRSGRRYNPYQQSGEPTSGRRPSKRERKRGSSFKPPSERGFRSVAPGSSSRLSRRHARDNQDGYGTLNSYELHQKRRTSKPAMGRKARTKCAVAALNRREKETEERMFKDEAEVLVLDDSDEKEGGEQRAEGAVEDLEDEEQDKFEEDEEDFDFQQPESYHTGQQPLFRAASPSLSPTLSPSRSTSPLAEHAETSFDLELKPHLPPHLYARYLDRQHPLLSQVGEGRERSPRRVRFASPEAEFWGGAFKDGDGDLGGPRRKKYKEKGKKRARDEEVEEEEALVYGEGGAEFDEPSPSEGEDHETPQMAAWRAAMRRQKHMDR